MPSGAQYFCWRSALCARYEPSAESLAPARRAAIGERPAGTAGSIPAARKMIQIVSAAYGHSVSYECASLLVTDYVADIPMPAFRAWCENGDVESSMPYGAISGMVFAAVTRAFMGVRPDRWCKLDFSRTP